MGLEHVDREELISRLRSLSKDVDIEVKVLGEQLEKVGRIQREIELIQGELVKRDA